MESGQSRPSNSSRAVKNHSVPTPDQGGWTGSRETQSTPQMDCNRPMPQIEIHDAANKVRTLFKREVAYLVFIARYALMNPRP
jgi:hypothetical protein